LAFCLNQGEEPDLERGVFLLCRTQYPQINLPAYSALLDEYAGDLRERLNLHATADQILPVINDYLFLERKFAGDELNLCDPENCYFNRVLDRRVGNHVTLGLLYLLLARRLHLPMVGIGLGLPDQFLCRYQSSLAEIYIDPLHGGRQLLKVECIKMVMQLQHRFDDSFLAPLSARRILLRICASLHRIYIQQKSLLQAERLKRYLVILAK
jgi:regulator of sirC expression with transglutaminase-like and TPR domain